MSEFAPPENEKVETGCDSVLISGTGKCGSKRLLRILDLEVVNVRAGEGVLRIVLYDSESSYRDGDQIPFRSITVPADREEHMTLQIEGVPPGRYAFIIYQDLNGNDDIDSNFIGWPKEPFGFSNNPPIRFGPPSFKKTSFEVTHNQHVRVELR